MAGNAPGNITQFGLGNSTQFVLGETTRVASLELLIPILLAVVALLYSTALPMFLRERARLRATPVATLVLWQALALGGVLAALGGGVLAVSLWLRPDVPTWIHFISALAALLAGLVLIRLLVSGYRVGRRLRSIRKRHRDLVDLLGNSLDHAVVADVRVVESTLPVAYCLPAWRSARIVLASSALEHLSRDQLAAVLAHERAHLIARHDLLLEAFAVLDRAFPRVMGGAIAAREVGILVEILADRSACAATSCRSLVEAMAILDEISATQQEISVAFSAIPQRLANLRTTTGSRRGQALGIWAIAAVVFGLPVWLLVLWLIP